MKLNCLAVVCTVAFLFEASFATQAEQPVALIRDIALGEGALVVKADGSVLFWGRDSDGQAARPPSPTRIITSPIVLDLPGKVLHVALNEATQYALLEDGTIRSWGTNDEGQLGSGPMGANGELGRYPRPSVTPVRVTGLDKVIQIKAGRKYALALREDGTVWAWGTRDDGALGDGKPTTRGAVPAIGAIRVPGLEGIKQIAVARTFSLALRADGHVMSWGVNTEGELGVGTRDTGWLPAEVVGLDHVVAIAAGTGASGKGVAGAVKDDGTVWMWGTNTSAQMGNGQGPLSPDDPGARNPRPVQVKGVAGAKSMSIGFGHVAALLSDGTLQMWGHDGWGQIGVGTSGAYQPKPMKVTGITNVAAVYLGATHSFAVRTDGTLWVWGFRFLDAEGPLGKYLHVPTRVDLP